MTCSILMRLRSFTRKLKKAGYQQFCDQSHKNQQKTRMVASKY